MHQCQMTKELSFTGTHSSNTEEVVRAETWSKGHTVAAYQAKGLEPPSAL